MIGASMSKAKPKGAEDRLAGGCEASLARKHRAVRYVQERTRASKTACAPRKFLSTSPKNRTQNSKPGFADAHIGSDGREVGEFK